MNLHTIKYSGHLLDGQEVQRVAVDHVLIRIANSNLTYVSCMFPCRADYIFILVRGASHFGPLGPTSFRSSR